MAAKKVMTAKKVREEQRRGRRRKKREKKSAKKVVFKVLAVLIFLIGLSVFFYPTLQKKIFTYQTDKTIQRYEDTITQTQAESGEGIANMELRQAMQDYNQQIYVEGQSGLTDPFSYEEASFDLQQWDMPDDVFGYLKIDRMNLEVPIYLGASKENMSKGVVHLSQTSLPIGGINTNAVIAGHRGMRKTDMFRHIETLRTGDTIVIRNPWETLTYRVTEAMQIEPDEIDKVLIQEGKDLVTLLTCHPYPVNNKRYVVYCERVEADEGDPQETEEMKAEEQKQETGSGRVSAAEIEQWIRIGCSVILVVSAVAGVICAVRKSRRD